MVKSEVEEEDQSTADEGKSEDDDGTEHLGRGARSKVKVGGYLFATGSF
jgi:hypothetical protein